MILIVKARHRRRCAIDSLTSRETNLFCDSFGAPRRPRPPRDV
ncbi:hypothetical protein [Limimaricola sp.]|nr:hypothetical protein [Limimaricola sp.]